MEKVEGKEKGTIVLATVKGDVHDIGKNLADIILTNNGCKVVNPGIKQPIDNILAAAIEHEVAAVGMTRMPVTSTGGIREKRERMRRDDLTVQVMRGGVGCTAHYAEPKTWVLATH